MLKKCAPLWREAHFQVKSVKTWRVRSTFGRSDVVLRGMRKGFRTWSKVSKKRAFCSSFKSVGRRGTFEEDLDRCILRGRLKAKDMFIKDDRRSGRWFPESGCIWEHQIFRFARMIWRDSTSYDLASLFRGRRQHFYTNGREKSQNALVRGRQLWSALNCPFLKEVSQNCFVFDVVKFKNWRTLAIASFLTLSI